MEQENQGVDLNSLEKEMGDSQQENQYLKSRNFGLQEAVDSSFMPKPDANIIEYKLSSEDLLSRIEHYLRGDIIKTKINDNGEVESFYSSPTKKITALILKEKSSGFFYIIDENLQNKKVEEDWVVISIVGKDQQEEKVEEDYGKLLAEKIKKLYKDKKLTKVGYSTRELIDETKLNLSDYGVSEVMNTLSMYISKETFLSYYKEERINEIMADIGDELNKFFLINGRVMGLNTEYKKTKYPLMLVTILNTIESAYRRSINGNENRGTREGIVITQNQSQMPQNPAMMGNKKKWNPFDKTTW